MLRLWDLGISFWVNATKFGKEWIDNLPTSFPLGWQWWWVLYGAQGPPSPLHSQGPKKWVQCLSGIYCLVQNFTGKAKTVSSPGWGSEGANIVFPLAAWKYQCLLPCWHYWDLALLGNRNLIFQDAPFGLSDISFAIWLFQLVIPHIWYL